MKKYFLLLLVINLTVLNGCALFTHDEEIETLQNYSKSGEDLDAYVAKRDAQFASLLSLAENNDFSRYPDVVSITKKFGPPILKKSVESKEGSLVRYLYRKQTQKFHADKVYLYFDQSDKLVSWEVISP